MLGMENKARRACYPSGPGCRRGWVLFVGFPGCDFFSSAAGEVASSCLASEGRGERAPFSASKPSSVGLAGIPRGDPTVDNSSRARAWEHEIVIASLETESRCGFPKSTLLQTAGRITWWQTAASTKYQVSEPPRASLHSRAAFGEAKNHVIYAGTDSSS